MGALINFIICIISFVLFVIYIRNSKTYTWYICLTAGICGFFLSQTIISLFTKTSLIDLLIN